MLMKTSQITEIGEKSVFGDFLEMGPERLFWKRSQTIPQATEDL